MFRRFYNNKAKPLVHWLAHEPIASSVNFRMGNYQVFKEQSGCLIYRL